MALTSRVSRDDSTDAYIRATSGGFERVLPQAEFYRLLWAYYWNNGLYDELRLMGYHLNDAKLRSLRNPAFRTVEFYAGNIWPGRLPEALPLRAENERLQPAIEQLWGWSNWSARKQVQVRWAGVTGDAYIRVSQPEDGSKRVFLQLIDPQFVTDKSADERGYLTYCRIDVPQQERVGDKTKPYTHTEVWDRERRRTWRHTKSTGTTVEQLGAPDTEIPLAAWGIDFVPVVHIQHLDAGDTYGAGAYVHALDKVDEVNRQVSRLHQMIFRHNKPTWALEANMMSADGRPMPAPRIGTDNGETVDLGDETMYRLPGMAKLASLVPALDYKSHLDAIEAQLVEIRADLPELEYYSLRDAPELSGRAIRLLMAPALARVVEVRGNHEDALIRAQMMALSIGRSLGAWQAAGIPDPGDYQRGDYAHAFLPREVVPFSRQEIAELTQQEVGSGLPLVTSLRRSGWSDEEIEQMLEEREGEQIRQQAGLGAALMEAQARFDTGQGDNGLTQ